MSGSFIQELKRRNVFRVTAIYVIVSWLLMQIGDVMFPALRLPEWTTTMLVAFLLLGFPIAVILAWAYEVTPKGVKRTKDVEPGESITHTTGRKIDFIIIAVLAVVVVFLIAKVWFEGDTAPSGIASVADRSIAVLPFANISAAEENAEFFAAGVHDELLTLLSRLGGIKVISRTSVENLDDGLSIPEIGALLGIATVLEGQVQRAGNRLRIHVQLIDALKEDHLWATTYDRELTAENVFEVQSDIAKTIADALHVQLSESDEALLGTIPTENTQALNRYLLGRQHMHRSTFESLRRAERYFKEVTELDPGYAQAWAAIAYNRNQMLLTGSIDAQEYIAVAEPAISRALELDDRLPEGQAQLAVLRWRSGDFAAAETSFKAALELNPGDSTSLLSYGRYIRMTGRPLEAIPVLEKALQNDPLSVQILFNLGKSAMYTGDPEQNIAYSNRILEIDPSSSYGYTGLLQAYIWMGRWDLQRPWSIKMLSVDPEDFELWAHIGLSTNLLGDPDLADRYLGRALELGPTEPTVLKCLAQVHRQRGQYDEALTIARRALEADLDDRWGSDAVFLRLVRDDAFKTGAITDARAWYRDRHPELLQESPKITIDNINAAADLALLLQQAGEADSADTLIDAGLSWYREKQVPGVHGYLTNIVDVELLALHGEKNAALDALRQAVDGGWRWSWPWYMSNENLSSLKDEPEFQEIIAQLEDDMATQLKAIQAVPDMGEADLRFPKSD
ncbi:MAG: tetratricopeptide repeat protein [Gammaproteobacteria bacterium]|nr:tetratricopeptide repeat protein [Gammaproteobacteria bacterium]